MIRSWLIWSTPHAGEAFLQKTRLWIPIHNVDLRGRTRVGCDPRLFWGAASIVSGGDAMSDGAIGAMVAHGKMRAHKAIIDKPVSF